MASMVVRVSNPVASQTKDYDIGICCFSAKQVALSNKSKDWWARSQDNMSELSKMSTRERLCL